MLRPHYLQHHLFQNYYMAKKVFLNHAKRFIATTNRDLSPLNLAFDSYTELKNERNIENTNPLVIVHGLFGQKQNFRTIAKALQKELDNFVYTVDMRNHGHSPHSNVHTYPAMAADLHEFIQREVLIKSRFKTFFLLGHSMGGKVVAEYAVDKKKSSMIEKLIIVDVSPHRPSNSDHFFGYIRALKQIDLGRTRSEINNTLKLAIPDDPVRTFLLTNLYKQRSNDPFQWRCNLDALEANLQHILAHKLENTKRAVTCPTLFISGQNSNFLMAEDQIDLKNIFRDVKFQEIQGAGHWVHSEKPKEFLLIVLDFLKGGYFTY